MSIQAYLQKLHAKAVSNPWLKLFSSIVRGWLAVGFIIPGLKKMINIPFAPGIPKTQPIGYFFDAFFQATEFYIFVGVMQVTAGILLLFPVTSALGALLYLPIIFNIFFITIALGFKGTWLITALMLLANLFLICWEFDKWHPMVPGFVHSQYTANNKHLNFTRTILASGLSGILTFGILLILVGIAENHHLLYPVLITASSLLLSVYALMKYHKKHSF